MAHQTDVLICGGGSAGLCAAAWLARYGVAFKLLERRGGPLQTGQADGVQCRTVEVFESFGIAGDLVKEAYHVLEVAFWSPGATTRGGIVRTKRTADTPAGLSHLPHVILNQARVNGLLVGAMRRAGGPEIEYGYEVKSVAVDGAAAAADPDARCVAVVAERDGVEEEFRAKYVLGCDGAHSVVRKSLGVRMVGDSTDAVWGVMDVYPQTDFPDVRKKAIIQSAAGNLIIIPREGGELARFYIELPAGVGAKDVQLEHLQDAARRIFRPYAMAFAGTAWWSAYAIGQRLADRFAKDDRVFLTGDACHTHSPKAGQGMNVSLQDGYNVGWKLGAVLTGRADPSLLQTYVPERQKVAADLIAFDRNFAELFKTGENAPSPGYVSEQFIKAGRYMAGLTARYDDSAITDIKGSKEHLAKGLPVGMRFPSTHVVRFCDAHPMQLARALSADGRWRVVIFPGHVSDSSTFARLNKLADFLGGPNGLVHELTPEGADIDSFIEPLVVLAGPRVEMEQEQVPAYFQPVTGKRKMRDLHKVYVDDEDYKHVHGHTYRTYGIDPEQGALAIVRPDQCEPSVRSTNTHVLTWQDIAAIYSPKDFEAIKKFFTGFVKRR